MTSLRLLSVNARVLPLDRPALARLIEDAAPDVACVHGAPSLLRWRSVSAALARMAGLVVVTGGRTSGGNLLLSTLGVDVNGIAELTFAGGHGVRPPGAALAALRLLGSDLVVTGARLGSAGAPQVAELLDAVDGLVPADLPAVLCVDGAGHPGSAVRQALAQGRVDPSPDGESAVFLDPRIGVAEVVPLAPGAFTIELVLP